MIGSIEKKILVVGTKVKILKNSEKYTVFKITKNKKNFILKVSNRSPNKILREIYHIKKLKKSSKFFDEKIPKIVKHGKIKRGINKNKGFYEMSFVKGPTLSELFQLNLFNKEKRVKIFWDLSQILIKEIRSAKYLKLKKNESFKLFKKLIDIEYKKIIEKDFFKNLLSRKKILINNNSFLNINNCLKKILSSKKIKLASKNYNYLSKNNHWNFHGGNIIFPSYKIRNFSIIDPDSSWSYNDPFFSIARLIYTFPHDTMEYDKYYLQSDDFFRKNKKKPISFKIKYTWGKKIYHNYVNVFKDFFNYFDKKNFFYKRLNNIEFIRLNLSLILCFLRGINANHQPKINFLKKKSNNFQNKGLYIYLFFLIYLNKFTKKLINDR